MKQDSVRIAVSALTSIIAVNAWIQYSTVNSETSASSGRCQETEGRKRWRKDDGETPEWEKRKSGNKRIRRRFGGEVDHRHKTRTRSHFFNA
jgi:hypothetical protein